MDFTNIQHLISQKESVNIEFKKSTGQLERGMETLCAFLNGNGGTVLFGVSDNGEILGQEIADTTKMLELTISKLKEQGKKDEKTIKEYGQPVEDSEESDDEEKSNITYDENEIKEAYENVMQNENESQNIIEIKVSKKSNRSRSQSKPKD